MCNTVSSNQVSKNSYKFWAYFCIKMGIGIQQITKLKGISMELKVLLLPITTLFRQCPIVFTAFVYCSDYPKLVLSFSQFKYSVCDILGI